MSTFTRLLSRRDKQTHEDHNQRKVMSLPIPEPVSTSSSSSISSSTSTGIFPHRFSTLGRASSTSLSSLSLAFTTLTPKRSPSLQHIEGTIHALTANSCEDLLLQPKQTAGLLHGLFPEEEEKPPVKDNAKKVKYLAQRLARAGVTSFQEPDLRHVLNAPYAKGDTEKAFDLLLLLEESEQGIIVDCDPNVKLLGAVNREGVSCYLDSVLFAMFARPGSFEAMLYNNFEDEPRKRLVILLRIWVNTLRLGKLITVDLTKQIQLRLSDCGWKEAATLCQQDASEAFSFITEKLALPLLTLKMDIYHTGKEEVNDDHKFVNERLLEVAVPEDPGDGSAIALEDCLETYFNSRIEVRRYLERRNTLQPLRSIQSINSSNGHALHIDLNQPDDSLTADPLLLQSPVDATPVPPAPLLPADQQAPSIVKEYFISEKCDSLGPSSPTERESYGPERKRAGSLRKEILMPAWQFYSLIPWYTDTIPTNAEKPSNDAQVAAHFSSTRPILGICLKRYSVLPSGQAVRRNSYIDIPLEIALPHFIRDDTMFEDSPVFGNFKLCLQSAVCHRGRSVDSGHYVSVVRHPGAEISPVNGSSSNLGSETASKDRWMRLDDLAKERVAFVNVEEFLRKESPYLLFYQVQPIEGDPGNIVDTRRTAELDGPPSYTESEYRYSGVGDQSWSFHDNLGTSGNSKLSRKPSQDEAAFQEPRPRSSRMAERPNSMFIAKPSANSDNFLGLSNSPGRANATELSPPVASHGDLRGRPARRNSSNGLSRSLSRFAGKLKKDKGDDVVTRIGAVSIGRESSTTRIGSSETYDETRQKRDSREKHGYGSVEGATSEHIEYADDRKEKEKQKAEKPERQCLLM